MKKILLTLTGLWLIPSICIAMSPLDDAASFQIAASFKLGSGLAESGIENSAIGRISGGNQGNINKEIATTPEEEETSDDLENCSAWTAPTGHNWNANGSHTIPATALCWDGYGAYSTIQVNGNPTYKYVNVRFWDGTTTINGSFTTRKISTTGNTSWYLKTLNPTYVFTSPVKVTEEVVLQQADDGNTTKGVNIKFNGGLTGSPRCTLMRCYEDFTDCPWASCSKCEVSTTRTCSCSTSECKIN